MRNFYTYKFEKFTPESSPIDKPKKKSVVNWGNFYRIILVLILFAYFSVLTKEFYNFMQTGLKLLILIVILQTFFKEYPVIDKVTNILSSTINFGTSITRNAINKSLK